MIKSVWPVIGKSAGRLANVRFQTSSIKRCSSALSSIAATGHQQLLDNDGFGGSKLRSEARLLRLQGEPALSNIQKLVTQEHRFIFSTLRG